MEDYPDDELAQLLKKVWQGDQDAFATLFRLLCARSRRWLRCWNELDVEEVLDDAGFRLWQMIRSSSTPPVTEVLPNIGAVYAHFRAWVNGALSNRLSAARTSKRGGSTRIVRLDPESPEHATAPTIDHDARIDIASAVARLNAISPRSAALLQMRLSGSTTSECAEELQVALGTVHNDWDFIKHFLRHRLDQAVVGSKAPSPGAVAMPQPASRTTAADRITLTLTCPPMVAPGHGFVVDVWAHLARQRAEVLRRAAMAQPQRLLQVRQHGPFVLPSACRIAVRLWIDELAIDDPVVLLFWAGDIVTSSFGVRVPSGAALGTRQGFVELSCGGAYVGKLHFTIRVAHVQAAPEPIETRANRDISSAFASYASQDRGQVVARLQGMQHVRPDIDIFLDIDALRAGQDWEKRIFEVIPKRDVFYLFWSSHARNSRWVDREWRCALETRGIEFISPVPLVPPEQAPPPAELESLHFRDRWLVWARP